MALLRRGEVSTVRFGVMSDATIEWMKKNGVPRTRDAYLALCFGADEPEDLGPEWEWPLLMISDAEPASA